MQAFLKSSRSQGIVNTAVEITFLGDLIKKHIHSLNLLGPIQFSTSTW